MVLYSTPQRSLGHQVAKWYGPEGTGAADTASIRQLQVASPQGAEEALISFHEGRTIPTDAPFHVRIGIGHFHLTTPFCS